jgi:NADPH-dependent curcumin reductase CurA
MEGGAVGRVIASNSSKFKLGDYAFGQFGWVTHGCLPACELRKLDPELMPITNALGVLGMPGFTGWYGLKELGRPKKGETLVVAAATGPVGSMVGQIAKANGLRAIGIAGGPDKCALAVKKFGFDDCLDHKAFEDSHSMEKALRELCPEGVDIYFENVAGKTLDAVLPLMNTGARIPVCGMISWYNAGALGANSGDDADKLPKMWRSILVKKMSVNGFIISDHWDRYGDFVRDVAPMVASGKIAYEEDIVTGLEKAPRAFMGLLEGKNFGKLIVKVK